MLQSIIQEPFAGRRDGASALWKPTANSRARGRPRTPQSSTRPNRPSAVPARLEVKGNVFCAAGMTGSRSARSQDPRSSGMRIQGLLGSWAGASRGIRPGRAGPETARCVKAVAARTMGLEAAIGCNRPLRLTWMPSGPGRPSAIMTVRCPSAGSRPCGARQGQSLDGMASPKP